MANTILKQFNDIGKKLGYPFYVYPDGTCGKHIISPNGKQNLVLMVKTAFASYDLKADLLTERIENEDEIWAYLMKIGDKIGFPFYVYSDGCCGSNAVSPINNLPFVMVVKRKVTIKCWRDDTCALSTENDEKKNEPEEVFWVMSEVKRNDWVARARARVDAGGILDGVEENAFFSGASDAEIEAYFHEHLFSESVVKRYIRRGDKRILLALIKYQTLSDKNQVCLVEHGCDEVILNYCQEHTLCVDAVIRINQMKRMQLLRQINCW